MKTALASKLRLCCQQSSKGVRKLAAFRHKIQSKREPWVSSIKKTFSIEFWLNIKRTCLLVLTNGVTECVDKHYWSGAVENISTVMFDCQGSHMRVTTNCSLNCLDLMKLTALNGKSQWIKVQDRVEVSLLISEAIIPRWFGELS